MITSDKADLRDAKLEITPEGKLMLCGAGYMSAYKNRKNEVRLQLRTSMNRMSGFLKMVVTGVNLSLWVIQITGSGV
ncbi:MAG: hypothetical protein R3C11_08680 [Planctomycetaceae bacterium]